MSRFHLGRDAAPSLALGSEPLRDNRDEMLARVQACQIVGALPDDPALRLRVLFLAQQIHDAVLGPVCTGEAVQ